MAHPPKLRPVEAECDSQTRAEREFSAECTDTDAPENQPEHCAGVGPSSFPRKKRLARARVEAAEALDELLDENWQSGRPDADVFSNSAIADRLLDVDEKTVRQWRNADKPMPIAALLCLPLPFGEDLTERLLSARRVLAGDRRAIVALGRTVDRVNAYAIHGVMSQSERTACRRALLRFVEQLTEIAESLGEP